MSAFPSPPSSDRRPVVEDWHGIEVVDDYRWLEERDDPDTDAWVAAQNAYTDAILGVRPERAAFLDRLDALSRFEHVGLPYERNGVLVYIRRNADEQQFSLEMRRGHGGDPRRLVDPLEFAPDGSLSVDLRCLCADGSRIAYHVRGGGKDEAEIRFRDVDAQDDLPDRLPEARYSSVLLTPDREGVIFGRLTADGPRLYHRRFGDIGEATILFGEHLGRDKLLFASLSADGRHLLIHVREGSAGRANQVWHLDRERGGPAVRLAPHVDGVMDLSLGGDRLFLYTVDGAPNGRILTCSLADGGGEAWEELVPEREGAVLKGMHLAGGRLLLRYLEAVRSRVYLHEADGALVAELDFGTLGTVMGISASYEAADAYLIFSSFHLPPVTYRCEIATGRLEVWFRADLPLSTDDLEVRQVWFPSQDGTRVPMFLVHAKGMTLDGGTPTILMGYGGFRTALTPMFSVLAALWVESGGVFAVPNIRGGGELGEAWHEAGMREKKQNTFDDFIAAAEWLTAEGYTRAEKLGILGGSNGGLLVGAALTQRPDLCQAAYCSAPLLDMLRYDRFLVAKYWVPEYGTAENEADFHVLYAYSPYHRVVEGTDYPAVLFRTGDGDTRVAPLHARKMAALVQRASVLRRPVLLRHHTDRGHAGGAPKRQQLEQQAEMLAFFAWQLNRKLTDGV